MSNDSLVLVAQNVNNGASGLFQGSSKRGAAACRRWGQPRWGAAVRLSTKSQRHWWQVSEPTDLRSPAR